MSPDGPKIVSPEEKLLRLIRGGKPAAAAGPTLIAPAGMRVADPAASAARATSLAVSLPRGLQWPAWWITAANIALGMLVVGELTMLAMMQFEPALALPAVLTAPLSESKKPAADAPKPDDVASELASPSSLALAAARPLFRTEQSTAASSSAAVKTPAANEQATALSQRLNLIGVIDGDPPQAIIEDTQSKRTYFVSVGQPVVEGLVVDEVQATKVILRLGDETITLSL